MLDKAKEKRLEALTQDGYNPYKTGAPGIVDVRVSWHDAVTHSSKPGGGDLARELGGMCAG